MAPGAGVPAGDTGAVPVTDLPRRDRAAGDTGSQTETGGLPRRVRQASLAPQLRSSTARVSPPASAGLLAGNLPLNAPAQEEHHEARTPDETRATLSAIQRGWQRGRSAFEPAGSDHAASGGDLPPPDAFPMPGGPADYGQPTGAPEATGLPGTNGHTDFNGLSDAPGPGPAEDLPHRAGPAANGLADNGDQPHGAGPEYNGDTADTGQFGGPGEPAGEPENGALADATNGGAPDAGPATAEDEPTRENQPGSDGGGLSGWS
jgi:hypothetical protein